MSLCEFILKVTKDKNPKLTTFDIGWTPLHEGAQNGHLLICYMIMNEITDKKPGDIDGITPLHAAAAKGHLETFKLIMNKVADVNLMWSACHKKSYLTNLEVRNLKSAVSALCGCLKKGERFREYSKIRQFDT